MRRARAGQTFPQGPDEPTKGGQSAGSVGRFFSSLSLLESGPFPEAQDPSLQLLSNFPAMFLNLLNCILPAGRMPTLYRR